MKRTTLAYLIVGLFFLGGSCDTPGHRYHRYEMHRQDSIIRAHLEKTRSIPSDRIRPEKGGRE